MTILTNQVSRQPRTTNIACLSTPSTFLRFGAGSTAIGSSGTSTWFWSGELIESKKQQCCIVVVLKSSRSMSQRLSKNKEHRRSKSNDSSEKLESLPFPGIQLHVAADICSTTADRTRPAANERSTDTRDRSRKDRPSLTSRFAYH